MFNPFKKLFEAFNKWADSKIGLNEGFDTPRALSEFISTQHLVTPMTEFEKDLSEKFETYRNHTRYRTLYVSVYPSHYGPHRYDDPNSGFILKGNVVASALNMGSYRDEIMFEQKYGRLVVMMLNLHGPDLKDQIPDWNVGTMEFPHQYLKHGLINVPNAAGLLATSPYDGIIPSDQIKDKRRYWAEKTAGLSPLPVEFKQPAQGLTAEGLSYYIPSDTIRGVYINENVQKTTKSKAYPHFPKQI